MNGPAELADAAGFRNDVANVGVCADERDQP